MGRSTRPFVQSNDLSIWIIFWENDSFEKIILVCLLILMYITLTIWINFWEKHDFLIACPAHFSLSNWFCTLFLFSDDSTFFFKISSTTIFFLSFLITYFYHLRFLFYSPTQYSLSTKFHSTKWVHSHRDGGSTYLTPLWTLRVTKWIQCWF